jgi:predicted nucleic acid-binding protein
MSFLIDSNVLIDIFTEDKDWFSWSYNILQKLTEEHQPLYINPIIYAEVSVAFEKIEDLENLLPSSYIRREDLPYEACFLAGKCFLRYRKQGGQKTAPLPDFFIGAHAAVKNRTLITRDKGRYSTYFPSLRLLTPEK